MRTPWHTGTLDGEWPALRLATAHPYTRDFPADGNPLPAAVLRLDQAPGDHKVMRADAPTTVRCPGQRLRYRVEA
jgi:hypothetical protein